MYSGLLPAYKKIFTGCFHVNESSIYDNKFLDVEIRLDLLKVVNESLTTRAYCSARTEIEHHEGNITISPVTFGEYLQIQLTFKQNIRDGDFEFSLSMNVHFKKLIHLIVFKDMC